MAGAVARDEVAVGDQARALARLVLQPPVWWLPAAAFAPLTLPAVWLSPTGAPLQAFGLSWGPRREAARARGGVVSRRLRPRLPALLRDVQRRGGGAPGRARPAGLFAPHLVTIGREPPHHTL